MSLTFPENILKKTFPFGVFPIFLYPFSSHFDLSSGYGSLMLFDTLFIFASALKEYFTSHSVQTGFRIFQRSYRTTIQYSFRCYICISWNENFMFDISCLLMLALLYMKSERLKMVLKGPFLFDISQNCIYKSF